MMTKVARWRRVSPLLCVLATLALAEAHRSDVALAQAPSDPFFINGRNVNTVGLTPPGPNPMLSGNPRHKQRNEASLDVSPANPLVLIGANNDYRGIETFGDSWIGLFTSRNGGLTWTSRLLDGFPATPQGVGAADPVARTLPGVAFVSYITINRTTDRGTLSLALLLERNKENGEPYQFLRSSVIGTGTPGRFNDKPAMIAVLNEAGGTLNVGGRNVPRGIIHYAYSLFPGNENNSASQIYHLLSHDHGLTWSNPSKLSESLGINQGADLAAGGSTVIATWRQVADTNQSDAIVFARSTDGGASWSKAATIWGAAIGRFFDQDTTPLQFRTRSMPSIVHDGSAFHVFWSARGFAGNPDDARIVVSSSRDGRQWSAPTVVEQLAARGHQIMPQAAVAGGRVQVNWIDTRHNAPGSFGRFINDYRYDPVTGAQVPLDAPAGPSAPRTYVYRQMADIIAAQSAAAGASGQPRLTFGAPQRVTQFRRVLIDDEPRQSEFHFVNSRMFQNGAVPFNGDYHAVAGQRYRASETTPGAWIRNTAPSTSHALFYSAFTDNRDAQGWVTVGPPVTAFTPSATLQGEPGTETPTACDASGSQTTLDQTVWSPTDSPRSRFQNIYAAPTFPALLVASPSASKPTGTLERAYVVFVRNLTSQDRSFRLAIANQPSDSPPAGLGRASFRQDDPSVPFTSCADGAACRALDVTIPRGSSLTRTVYIRSTLKRPRVVVTVQENGGSTNGSVILNADPDVAEVENPDGEQLPSILEVETYQPDILGRESTLFVAGLSNPDVTPVQSVENPRIEYPRIEYPRIEYPRIEYDPLGYPRIEYPRIEYDAVGTPRIEYPRIEYPRIEYSSVENPRIEYSAIGSDDVGVTDVTWPISTDGANTTTAMTAKVLVNGTLSGVTGAQLLVSIPHFTTVTRTCNAAPITTVENQIVVNTVIDPASLVPTPGGPDTVNPPAFQPSFAVQPNQVAFLTLRLVGRADAQLARRAGLIVRSQPDMSDGDVTDEDKDTGFVDVTPPVINLGGLSGGLAVEGNKPGGGDVSFTVTASDDGGDATVSCVRTGSGGSLPLPSNGTSSFVPLGEWEIVCTAVDSSGNQASGRFDLVVADHTPPTLDVSGLTISLAYVTGGATITYNASAVTATDLVDSTPTVGCTPASGAFVALGSGQLRCTATDDSGNTATANRSFTVADTVAPVLTVPGPIVVAATSGAGAVVSFTATAIDAIDSTPTVNCTPPSGTSFPLGVTTVSCSASDDSGNVSTTRTFTVTVSDTIPPAPITATVVPALLWPPNGALVQVTVSGTAIDNETGMASLEWRVIDEYKQHQPSGTLAVAGNGPFTFKVPLIQDRRGNDRDGRHYTIQLTAVDRVGNRRPLAAVLVVNVHDQSQ